MTPSEIADCRVSHLAFSKTMFKARGNPEFIHNEHQDKISDALEKVVLGKIKRLVITVPPRSGKTELAVVNFIAWSIGNFPDSEYIHPSYSKRLSAANAYNARALIQLEEYQEVFPWVKIKHDSKARDEFRTTAGGCVYATGAEGTITGYGAGKMRPRFGGAIVIDDPHKAGEANSDVTRQNVIEWFQVTIESRKNTPDTPIIVIMQRLHEEDLAGWLLAGGNGEHWDHVNIPAVKDNGESFWERQFPIEDLRLKERTNAYVFAGQYMQSPAPLGGGIFKDDWWRFYTVPPLIKYRQIHADTAQKTKEKNDYTVLQCWGETDTGQAILLDQIRGKWEAPELLTNSRAFWAKHKAVIGKGTLRAFKVEDKVSGTGLIQTLKREGIPMIAVQRNIDKITRAYDAAPFIESGNVLLPRDTPWLSDYLSEFSVFPNGANDDQVDPTMDAVVDILQGGAAQPQVRAL